MRLMRFPSTFRRFSWKQIEIIDTVGGYVEGVWVEREPLIAPRIIRAIPLAMSPEELEIYSNGESSATGITLTTKDILYFTDINATDQETRQSYALYQGYKYRCVGENLMRGNVHQLTIYNLLRYIQ